MDNKTIKGKRSHIIELLEQKRLKLAFLSIKELLAELSDWHYSDKFEEIENGYKYMLQYMQKGVIDPMQRNLYRKFISESYALTDRITDKLLLKDEYIQYYTKRRYFLSQADSIENIYTRFDKDLANISLAEIIEENGDSNNQKNHLRVNIEQETDNLFNYIWTSFNCPEDDANKIASLFDDIVIPANIKALLISAITLALLQYYEENKLELLISLIENNEDIIKQRAIIGVILTILKYEKRIELSEHIKSRISLLKQDKYFAKSAITIQNQFIKSRETDKITKKMNEEIIPEMLKMNPGLNKKMSDDLHSLDINDLDYNPEWEEYLKESGIANKLKEISELQLEGADVLMSTFSNLKGFPFFSKISNWFMPFDKNNSFIADLFVNKASSETFLNIIDNSRFMCNSDKYSFCLSMMQLPESQRSIMADQFSEQGSQMKELEKAEDSMLPQVNKSEIISNQYLQDLYRFYKLNYNKNEFADIFNSSLSLYNNTLLKDIFDQDSLYLIAELLFKKKYYAEALDLYKDLLEINKSDHALYQKIGYCYQELGDYVSAIQAYNNSDIIRKDSPWTIRRMAICYRLLKDYNTAIEFYKRYLELKPDTLSAELSLGHCYLDLKNYEQALVYYYKVEYLDPKNVKTYRPMAWCSFKLGKFEQAEKFYSKILDNNPTPTDHINAGHNYWALGNIEKAITEYKECLAALPEKVTQFTDLFLTDKNDLIEAGVEEEDIYLMLDQVLEDQI